MGGRDEPKPIASNRRARHEYEILDSLEAGIALRGPEVKSLREGRANLSDAYAIVRGSEVVLRNLHISPYQQAGRENPDPTRDRKLLLHRHEINRLVGQVERAGYTLVPLNLHYCRGRVKLDIGLAKGKKQHDKRETEKLRDWNREKQRLMRTRTRTA